MDTGLYGQVMPGCFNPSSVSVFFTVLCDAYVMLIQPVSFLYQLPAACFCACPYINHMAAVLQDTVFIETHEGIPDTGDACPRQENVIQASH